MSFDSSAKSPSQAEQASVVWFISFGDLLTLLVCFFFVLTPQLTLKQAGMSENKVLTRTTGDASAAGTAFANSSLGVTGVPRAASRHEQVMISSSVWREEIKGVWQDYRARSVAHSSKVRIRLCSSSEHDEVLASMLTEIKRSEQYVRAWELEVFSECAELSEQALNAERVLAVVEFSET